MDLLAIAQRVTDEVGLPRPTAVATASDQLSRQLFALANATLEDLGDKDWPCVSHTFNFDTVVNQQSYDTPNGFRRLLPDTMYNQANQSGVDGSLTPQMWQQSRTQTLNSTNSKYQFRFAGNPLQIKLTPTPQIVETLWVDYIGTERVTAEDSTLKELFTADTDTPLFPDILVRMGLKWRIKHAKGLDYSEDYNAYQAAVNQKYAQECAFGSVAITRRTGEDVLMDGYVPENGFG